MTRFATILYRWADEHPRPMPWRGEKDPYKIWLSEVILQQTRVEQGIPYYMAFIERFPSVAALAGAQEQEVLKLWQGLGYNSRARNLLEAARQIMDRHDGRFPENHQEILALKGIGPYAAAAIASFAFDLAYPVLDANVARIMARYFGIMEPIELPATQALVRQKLVTLFDAEHPARFNQAIMDFGALQCKPQKPVCANCPMQEQCAAIGLELTEILPIKSPKKARKEVHKQYLVIEEDGKLLLRKRDGKDIWKGMFEFPEGAINGQIMPGNEIEWQGGKFEVLSVSDEYRQLLTHRDVKAVFIRLRCISKFVIPPDAMYINLENIKKSYPVPGIIEKYLSNFDNSIP